MRASLLAIMLAVSPLAAPASFADDTETISMRNVDMNDPAQVARVHQAVVRTASNICDRMGASAGAQARQCVRETVDRAVRNNPSEALRAYHDGLPSGERYQLASAE